MRSLEGAFAVVTGASRGCGRGIACALGEAGATVCATGRTARGPMESQPEAAPGEAVAAADDWGFGGERRETIDETAELVSARGGQGVAIRCDHSDDDSIARLRDQLAARTERIDMLVNNAWGGYEMRVGFAPFWESPLEHWDLMFGAGVRAAVATTHALADLLRDKSALVVNITGIPGMGYPGGLFYFAAKRIMMDITRAMAHDFKKRGVAVVGVAPGFMRTERVLDAFKTDAMRWSEVEQLEETHSPEYVGRAIVALAHDENVQERNGGVFEVGALAREYGFTDIDGRVVPPFSEQHPELMEK